MKLLLGRLRRPDDERDDGADEHEPRRNVEGEAVRASCVRELRQEERRARSYEPSCDPPAKTRPRSAASPSPSPPRSWKPSPPNSPMGYRAIDDLKRLV